MEYQITTHDKADYMRKHISWFSVCCSATAFLIAAGSNALHAQDSSSSTVKSSTSTVNSSTSTVNGYKLTPAEVKAAEEYKAWKNRKTEVLPPGGKAISEKTEKALRDTRTKAHAGGYGTDYDNAVNRHGGWRTKEGVDQEKERAKAAKNKKNGR